LVSPENFEDEIINATAVSPATAEQLISDINMQILEPIHEFVMNQGKAPDPLTATGIIVEAPMPAPMNIPKPPTAASPTVSLEIPASPEPTPQSRVRKNFDDYFMQLPPQPPQTDSSVLK
jgi:hypothetical protein